ncbi:MAG: alanine racemase [Sulfurimonas sp.]|nr:alanine racemase [Sulfurimonas sp.]
MAYITLNKNNFFNNLDIITNKTKTKDKVALVLKDNAYGHGLIEVATMAKEYGITKAVVRCQVEADAIKDFFDYVLVLAEIPSLKSDKIRYTVNDIKTIKEFPRGTKVELKVDTLMHRNGVDISEVEEAISLIKEQRLILEAVFTHHRSADELTSEYFTQNENFKEVKKIVLECGFTNIKFHSANSASLMRYDNFDEDMARVGIAAYGCLQSEACDVSGFKAVLSLTAIKNSSREVKKGDRVGYGATYEIKEDCTISNYDFGYADGFFRSLSNNYVTPHHKELIGKISMDNSSFIAKEDELLIFSDARVVAQNIQTISYEILTALKPYIKRVIK